MIIDQIRNAALYSSNPRLRRALDYLAGTDFASLPPGKVELDGANLYALIIESETRLKEECLFEAHRNYADVQYIVRGTEKMGYAPVGRLSEVEPYDPQKDAAMLKGEGDFFTATPGTFVVFYPEDAHMPSVAVNDKPGPVKKVVVKIRLAP